MYNKGLFSSWVPKPLMLILILIMLMPVLALNGVYLSNLNDIAGALATYSEYITLASNATVVGMGVSLLVTFRVKMRFRSKEIIAGSSILLATFCYMNGTTDNPLVLVSVSFLIGFVKVFPMAELILPVMFIIAPNGDRGKFYAVFYPLSIAIGQLSSYWMSSVIFNGNWQAPYFIMAMVMLIIAALSLIFQHNQRFCFKKPLYQIDWITLLLLSGTGMSFNYFFTFMRQRAWFDSTTILLSGFFGVIFMMLTVYRQRFLKRLMINFKLFRILPSLSHALVLLLFLGIYMATAGIYSQYAVGVLGYNSLTNARVNLWMIPGVVLAGIMAFYGFKYNWPVKFYIMAGFISFFLHTFSLYLMIQPQMDICYLQISIVLKGLGMGILFIGISFYGLQNMQQDDMFGVMSIIIMLRSYFGAAVGSAIIGWATYRGQWQSLNDITMYLDSGDIFNNTASSSALNLQAIMSSLKIVLGAICWLVVPILVFIWAHHYGRFNIRRIVFFRKVIKGSPLKGYKFS